MESRDKSTELRILCFGAGAIGTYVAGSLALMGHQVHFIERPEISKFIRDNGICISIQGCKKQVKQFSIYDSINEAFDKKSYDLGIFAVKSYDTLDLLKNIEAYKDKCPPILCLQNGVENEELIMSFLGESRVIAGTVTSSVGKKQAGDIILEKKRGIGISSNHLLSTKLVKEFNDAGLNAKLYKNPKSMKWSKILTNLLVNASSAILDLTPQEILNHEKLFELEIHQLREALSVMHAQKIKVVNLPGTPVQLLAFSVKYLPIRMSRFLLKQSVSTGRGAKMPSLHIDLHAIKGKSEVDYLNGAISRIGKKYGIKTPVNTFYNETLLSIIRNNSSPNKFAHNPEIFLKTYIDFAQNYTIE